MNKKYLFLLLGILTISIIVSACTSEDPLFSKKKISVSELPVPNSCSVYCQDGSYCATSCPDGRNPTCDCSGNTNGQQASCRCNW